MNLLLQKCDQCGTLNQAAATNWIRTFGAFAGSPSPVLTNGAAAHGQAKPALVDLCPTCAGTVTVTALVALTTKATAAAPTTAAPVVAPAVKPVTQATPVNAAAKPAAAS